SAKTRNETTKSVRSRKRPCLRKNRATLRALGGGFAPLQKPTPLRAPAVPAEFPDGSPRTVGPQPHDVLRLARLPDGSPRTVGPQPHDVLRLAQLPERIGTIKATRGESRHPPGPLGARGVAARGA